MTKRSHHCGLWKYFKLAFNQLNCRHAALPLLAVIVRYTPDSRRQSNGWNQGPRDHLHFGLFWPGGTPTAPLINQHAVVLILVVLMWQECVVIIEWYWYSFFFFIINNFISWKVYVGITCGITIDIALILLTIERDRPAQSHCYIDNLHNITIRLTPLLTLGNVLLPIGYNGERTSIYRCIREVYPVLMAGDSYIFSCQHRKSNTCGLCGLINTTGNQMYYRCISQCARAMPKLL